MAIVPLSPAMAVSTLVQTQEPPAPAVTVIAKVISGDNRIDPLIDDISYRLNAAGPVGSATTVTYSFPTTMPSSYTGASANEWNPFSEQQKTAVRDILALLQKEIKITFQEVTESANVTGTMRFSNITSANSAGFAFLPNATQTDLDADVFISKGAAASVAKGSYAWLTLVHEIGHALGLNHPGNYNAGEPPSVAVVGNFLGVNEDAFFNSIMSYRQSAQFINDTWFMPYDLLTLRYLYGGVSYETGNNAYKFTDVDGQSVNSILDDGGVDTLDFSALTSGITVDLTPGAYSSIGLTANGSKALANLTTAFDAVVESVLGTTQADSISGNSANNTITGGAGDDVIDGGAGADTAVFSGPNASYRVTIAGAKVTIQDTLGNEGTDNLTNVERLKFSDFSVGLDTGATQPSGQTALLIGAVLPGKLVFDPSKQALLGTVIGLFDQGFSSKTLAGALMRLDIWGVLANGGSPGATNTQIANYLLTNVNGIAPNAAPLAAGTAALDKEVGNFSLQGDFLSGLASSTANQAHIGFTGLATSGLVFVG